MAISINPIPVKLGGIICEEIPKKIIANPINTNAISKIFFIEINACLLSVLDF